MTATRLLIATIGENDPISAFGPMAALRAAVHDHPDLVFLVHTAATSLQAEVTRDHIARTIDGARIHLLALPTDDPTDIATMLSFLHGRWAGLRRELAVDNGRAPRSEDVEVFACGTSGTREMGLALTESVDLTFPWTQHWTALRPDAAPDGAVAPSRDPYLRPFHLGLLRREHESREGFRLLASCRFHEAAARFDDQLRIGARLPDERSPLHLAARLASAFRDLADQDVGNALASMLAVPTTSAGSAEMGAPDDVTAGLRRIEAWYAPIERAIHSPNDLADPWPAELVAGALRERAAGRLALAVTKLQTAFEVSLQVRLTQLSGRPAAHSRDAWDRMLDRLRRRDVDLDRALRVSADWMSDANQLARARNDLVHRGRTQHDLEQVLEDGHRFVDGLLRAFGWHTSADAPTTPEEVRTIAALIADWAGLPLAD